MFVSLEKAFIWYGVSVCRVILFVISYACIRADPLGI